MTEPVVREASPSDYAALGDLTVRAYLSLEGMPSLEEGRAYYDDLRDVAGRAKSTRHRIVAAYDPGTGALLGGLTFILDRYGSVWKIENSAGIRMLAVDPAAQSRGVGRALVEDSLTRARAADKQVVLLHTTAPMKVAQRMYEQFGFRREPGIDFQYVGLDIMGYRLDID